MNSLSKKEILEMEKRMDDFDSDAYVGFKNAGLSSASLKALDKKHGITSAAKTGLIATGSALVIGSLIVAYLFLNKNEDKKNLIAKKQFRIEKTEVEFPKNGDSLIRLSEKTQIKPSLILSNQERISNFQESNEHFSPIDIEVPAILLEPLPTDVKFENKTLSVKSLGKHIFYSDLKILDYRLYRENQVVEVEQYILTGTPANLETIDNQEEELKEVKKEIPYMDYLERTMKLFSKGQWKKSLARFEEILMDYPDDVNARFYGGLCQYNLQNYRDASINFSICLQQEYANFNEEAIWYLALSKDALGEKQDANKLFLQIINEKGFYAKQAEKML